MAHAARKKQSKMAAELAEASKANSNVRSSDMFSAMLSQNAPMAGGKLTAEDLDIDDAIRQASEKL